MAARYHASQVTASEWPTPVRSDWKGRFMGRFVRRGIITTATVGAPRLTPMPMLVPTTVSQLIVWCVANTVLTPGSKVAQATFRFDSVLNVVMMNFAVQFMRRIIRLMGSACLNCGSIP